MQKIYSLKEASELIGITECAFRGHVSKKHILPLDNVKTKRLFFSSDEIKKFVHDYLPNKNAFYF